MAMLTSLRALSSVVLALSLVHATRAEAAPDAAAIASTLAPYQQDIEWMKMNEDAGLDQAQDDSGAELIAHGKQCFVEVDALIAAHAPMTTSVKVRSVSVTLADAKTKICQMLATKAATWDASVAAAKGGAKEEASAPYKAIGMSGDKLDLMVRHNGYAMYAIGGRELTTPKDKQAASVLFELLGDSHSDWTVRRYQFKGDKLVGTTEQVYRRRPGASAFR